MTARLLPSAVLAVALVLWLLSLPGLRDASISQYGLLVSGPVTFPIAILLVVLAYIVAIRRRDMPTAVCATIGMIVVQRVTVPLVTETAPYTWTYKHVGVVDYIMNNGHLARGVDIYHGWPGLFTAVAQFCEVTGVSPLTVAHWFAPCVHLLIVGLVVAIARAWGRDVFQSITAGFVAETLNWVAQDYFSPQATGFLLALGLLLIVGRHGEACSRRGAALILTIFTAIVVVHQLTPYWLLLACLLLAATKRLRPSWIVVAMAAIALSWLGYNWQIVSNYTLFSLDLFANAESNITTVGVYGQRVTSVVVRVLSATLWFSAAVVALHLRRKQQPVLAMSIVAFSPFLILAGQSYGNEAIFRVFLYALPGCSILVAGPIARMLQAGRGRLLGATIVAVFAVAAAAQGTYGGWFANKLGRNEVAFAAKLLNGAEYPSYLTPAAPGWPQRVGARYVDFAHLNPGYDRSALNAAELVGSKFDNARDYNEFMRSMASRGIPTYIIISDQMRVYSWYFGFISAESLDNLEDRMRADPRWVVVHEADTFTVFRSWDGTGVAPERIPG